MVKTVQVSAVGDLKEDGGEDGEDVAVQEAAPAPALPRYAPCVAGSKLNNSLLSKHSLP